MYDIAVHSRKRQKTTFFKILGRKRCSLEDTVMMCKTFNQKRFIWIINVYICKDIYRLNMWFLSSKGLV